MVEVAVGRHAEEAKASKKLNVQYVEHFDDI